MCNFIIRVTIADVLAGSLTVSTQNGFWMGSRRFLSNAPRRVVCVWFFRVVVVIVGRRSHDENLFTSCKQFGSACFEL